MRCLISFILICVLFIACALFIANGQFFGPVFSFSAAIASTAVLFFTAVEACAIVIFSILMCACFLFLNVQLSEVLQTIVLILSVSLAGALLRYSTMALLGIKEKVLNVVKEEYRSFYKLDEELKGQKLYLEKAVHDIISLYQAPKEMIAANTVEELIASMRKSITGYFDFQKCKIIIFSFKEKEPKIDKVFDLEQDINTGCVLSNYEEAACDYMKDRKGPLLIDRDANMTSPEPINLPDGIKTYIAIPLVAGDRLNGVFLIEGPLSADMIRFIILSHQFAIVLERIRLYELVQELAITDGLTDTFVRRHFLERLKEELARARHFNTKLSFLMIDIDRFKQCNDKFGHLVGDVILRETASIIKNSLREIDIMGRYGGEEFSVLLPQTTKNGAFIVGERLRKAVSSSGINAYDEKIDVNISIGIATYPDDADEINQLMDRADQMLYKAKDSGRNKVVVYGFGRKK
ncbi:MAG: sensor domain-containing diguanylate cyclase [Candidatus Omnitrophica bacterium]|nr:sensor domain-containing diguanylate cyclase [Candidatus Omnitrophota bacterium]